MEVDAGLEGRLTRRVVFFSGVEHRKLEGEPLPTAAKACLCGARRLETEATRYEASQLSDVDEADAISAPRRRPPRPVVLPERSPSSGGDTRWIATSAGGWIGLRGEV